MSSVQTYASRREVNPISFARGRNTVRIEKRSLGSISQIVIIILLTLICGLL